ncbi:MAG: RHS repeat-associated core domain-containing protein [Puia sp.]|nr:RHS repeat-associated core domain-containing protein [Puia sp.]
MKRFIDESVCIEQTDASGLIYMQARFYLPQYHRFSSPDPARDQHFEETQSWNIYSYCQNDPVMRIDPTGEMNFPSFADIWSGIKKVASAAANAITSADKAVNNVTNKVKTKLEKAGNKLAGLGSITNSERHEKLEAALNSSDKGATKTAMLISTMEMAEKFEMMPAGIVPVGGASAMGGVPETNPFEGPVSEKVTVVDPKGNALSVEPGQKMIGSPDGKYLQVREANGDPTGLRLDGGHSAASHPDIRGQEPHIHAPGVTNQDGTPWLPSK